MACNEMPNPIIKRFCIFPVFDLISPRCHRNGTFRSPSFFYSLVMFRIFMGESTKDTRTVDRSDRPIISSDENDRASHLWPHLSYSPFGIVEPDVLLWKLRVNALQDVLDDEFDRRAQFPSMGRIWSQINNQPPLGLLNLEAVQAVWGCWFGSPKLYLKLVKCMKLSAYPLIGHISISGSL